MKEQNQQEGELSTQRIEASSDGVFAIAITLPILEIRLPPHAEGTHESLAATLVSLWPSYFAYIFSFVMIGIYWVNHHYIFKIYQKTARVFNLLNVFFLMCISFLPFPTAVLGEHLLDEKEQKTAIIFYVFGLLLAAASWFLKWLYASCHYQLIDNHLSPHFVSYLTIQYGLSVIFYASALIISVIQPKVGLAIAVGLTFLYLLPSKKPAYT